MNRPTVLITGKNGQLGLELQEIEKNFQELNLIFLDRSDLDITDTTAVNKAFESYRPQYFINSAAYTAVDKAESDRETAFLINATAVGDIANYCKLYQTKLIHISTDYVFDGNSPNAYLETDETHPVNYYGFSKREGERLALINNPETLIIRTSWVYGKYGNNFVKTMVRLMNERSDLNVVNDQFGSPTSAKDLAETILKIVRNDFNKKIDFRPGIYHYSNLGKISWFEFADKIAAVKSFSCNVHPVATSQYPTAAKRPQFSVLSKEKIKNDYQIDLKNWEDSLRSCLEKL